MTFLDITSLQTDVPHRETVEYLYEQFREQEMGTTIPVNIMKELLPKCTTNLNFKFNGEIYRHINGVAIGSPLGPMLAYILTTKLGNDPSAQNIGKFDLTVDIWTTRLSIVAIILTGQRHLDDLMKFIYLLNSYVTKKVETEQPFQIFYLQREQMSH